MYIYFFTLLCGVNVWPSCVKCGKIIDYAQLSLKCKCNKLKIHAFPNNSEMKTEYKSFDQIDEYLYTSMCINRITTFIFYILI